METRVKKRRTEDKEVDNNMKKAIEKYNVNITLLTLIALLVSVIGFGITIQKWISTVENNFILVKKDIKFHVKTTDNLSINVEKLQSENTSVKVRLAMIETKLCNIELLLIEIKKDIRGK